MSAPNFCRQCGYRLKMSSLYCPHCGKTVTTIIPPTPSASPNYYSAPPQPPLPIMQSIPAQSPPRHNSSVAVSVAAVFLLLVMIGGVLLFVSMPHGPQTNPFACIPHEEIVYVGNIQTLAGNTVSISQYDKITQISYDTGLLTYTVHLTNDQGQQFTYHYVTNYDLVPYKITTGC
jgi:hypothetical protein